MEHPTKKAESEPGANGQPDSPERKPYHPPELTSYGDLATVTRGAGLKSEDAAVGSNVV